MDHQDLKIKISTAIENLLSNSQFMGIRDLKPLVTIGSFFGEEKLDQIFADPDLINAFSHNGRVIPDLFVYKFIQKLLNLKSGLSGFDPCLSVSSPVFYMNAGQITGICTVDAESKAIHDLFPNEQLKLLPGRPLDVLDQINDEFNFIVSFPPLGMKCFPPQGDNWPNDFAATLLLKSSRLLSPTGKMIFLLTPSFFWKDSIKRMLKREGLFVEAIFSLPAKTLAPLTGILSNLVVLSKKEVELTFVAELSYDEYLNTAVLNNYKYKKEGKVIQLGCFVDIQEFTTLNKIIQEKELMDWEAKTGLQPVLLEEITVNISTLKSGIRVEQEDLSNVVYLPKTGRGPTISDLSELRSKPENYFQIRLNPQKANANYVANYLNSPEGWRWRESIAKGAQVKRISLPDLANGSIYLPDIGTQEEVVKTNNQIQQVELGLEELKRRLWKLPREYESVEKELIALNKEDSFVKWVDSLPFPIASILWRYQAISDNGKKIEHLFHFFEAFSEFLSMLMLSALKQDSEFYKSECHKWVNTDDNYKDWYLRATFGSWNVLTARLSKVVRGFLTDKDKKEHCKKLFGNPSEAFLGMISNNDIASILDKVATLRNQWKGHGGITGEDENNQRILTLESHFNDIRRQIGDAFDGAQLLSPMAGIFEDGVYTINAKILTGTRTPFSEAEVKSIIPLDRKKLYWRSESQIKPIELIPFIKFVNTSTAIYFYSSRKKNEIRWVSYHFEKVPEINESDDSNLFEDFAFLRPPASDG